MKEIIEIDAVVKQLQEGLIGEETRGMVLRTVTTALSCQLVSSVDELQKQMNRISSLNNHLITRFEETILPLIQADTVSVDELFNYITTIQKEPSGDWRTLPQNNTISQLSISRQSYVRRRKKSHSTLQIVQNASTKEKVYGTCGEDNAPSRILRTSSLI